MTPFAAVYGLAMKLRNRRYDKGRNVTSVECPVISTGNITVGGTGKTPFVEWAAGRLRAAGRAPAVVCRGYKAAGEGHMNEEAALLGRNCPPVPVVCNPDRIAACREAIASMGADCVVLDDGFQHRRIHRDLDIVLIDATRPFGNARLLPAGILREPLAALHRAEAIVITRSDQVDSDRIDELRGELDRYIDDALVALAVHRPVGWILPDGRKHAPDWIDRKRLIAVSGIGNPAAFEKTITGLGGRIAEAMRFGDHHRYDLDDVRCITAAAGRAGVDLIATTQKDAVKMNEMRELNPGASCPTAWLRIEMTIVEGETELEQLLINAAATASSGMKTG